MRKILITTALIMNFCLHIASIAYLFVYPVTVFIFKTPLTQNNFAVFLIAIIYNDKGESIHDFLRRKVYEKI